jgi:hypothetical protein
MGTLIEKKVINMAGAEQGGYSSIIPLTELGIIPGAPYRREFESEWETITFLSHYAISGTPNEGGEPMFARVREESKVSGEKHPFRVIYRWQLVAVDKSPWPKFIEK